MKLNQFLRNLGQAVSFFPGMVQKLGSRNATILLCQLFYWTRESDGDDWICRSMGDIESATSLSEREQRKARKVLIDLGFLEMKIKKESHRTFYRIKQEDLNVWWEEACARGSGDPESGGTHARVRWHLTDRQAATRARDKRIVKENTNKSGAPPARSFVEVAVIKVENIVRQHNHYQSKPNRSKDLGHILQLLHQVGEDKGRVKAAINWSSSHYSSKWFPRFFSVEQFCTKFLRIEEHRRRHQADAQEELPLEVELSEEEAEVYEELQGLGWPKGADRGLKTALHDSWGAHAEWRKKARAGYAVWPEWDKEVEGKEVWKSLNSAHFAHSQCGELHRPTADFLRGWFNAVWKQVKEWKEWSGNMQPYTWHPRHKLFTQMGLEAVREERYWEAYLTAIDES